MARSSSNSVRDRRLLMAQKIDEIATAFPDSEIVSVACGHLREASLSQAIRANSIKTLIALDQDPVSIAVVSDDVAKNGWQITPICSSIRSILSGKFPAQHFSLVYAAGLYDYLETPVASRLTARMFHLLKPGGHLLVANFAPETEEQGYMEAFMGWNLIYRSEAEVAALTQEINTIEIERAKTFRDPDGNIVYLEIIRA